MELRANVPSGPIEQKWLKHRSDVKLVSPTKRLKDLLVITKLATVFDSFDDETAAVNSFPK